MSLYQDPRGYLLGLQGVALLRAFSGQHSEDFTCRRLQEVRALMADATDVGPPFVAEALTIAEGYAAWSSSYDEPGNGCFELDEPVIAEILRRLRPGHATDVACGTGRLLALLERYGHRVIGVDLSPDMLRVAQQKSPDVPLVQGDVHALPLVSGSQNLVLCTLALSHVPDLRPVFAEFSRVLAPGGHLIVSDIRGFLDTIRPPMLWQKHDGNFGYLPQWVHRTSDYLNAALAAGFHVRRCEEPVRELVPIDDPSWQVPVPTSPGLPPNVWELMGWCPTAAHAALRGTPGAIIWHFRRTEDPRPPAD
jgi:SAM-dependent methyltransferase